MAIYHDAYRFDLEKFSGIMLPILSSAESLPELHARLQERSIMLLTTSAFVRYLDDDYGTWGLTEGYEVPLVPTDDVLEEIGFQMMPTLYDCLSTPKKPSFGLGGNYRALEPLLLHLGLSKDETRTILYGKPPSVFANEILGSDHPAWAYFQPRSMLGRMGFLEADAVHELLDCVEDAFTKLNTLDDAHQENVRLLEVLKQMLDTAAEVNADLCIIISA